MIEYKVRYTTSSIIDLETIYLFILKQTGNKEIANDVVSAIKETINSLNTFPLRFQIIDESSWKEKGIRSALVKKHYVFYQVDEVNKVVLIMRIINNKQDINNVIN